MSTDPDNPPADEAPSPALRQRLRALRRDYLASLPGKAEQLNSALQDCRSSAWGARALGQLHTTLHRLAGSLGLHHLDALQVQARLACDLSRQAGIIDKAFGQQLEQQVKALITGLEARPVLKKVMLVDDDDDILLLAKMSLEIAAELEVVTCSSGQEALARLPVEWPDLVVLDVQMPGMDGPQTFEKIRQLESGLQVPVVFLTADVQQVQSRLAVDSGVAVLPKPFDPFALADDLRQIWNKLQP